MAEEKPDVCIVGSGAGGGSMAYALAKAGLKVVVLERGPWRDVQDFSNDELKWVWRDEWSKGQAEVYRRDEQSPVQGPARFMCAAYTVGGSFVHYASVAHRLWEDDFHVLSKEGPVPGADLADWPITYQDMEPYYVRAEYEYGVAANAEDIKQGPPRSKPFPMPAHPMKCEGQLFKKGCEKLGFIAYSSPRTINSVPYDGRPACNYNGWCQAYGCILKARSTPVHTTIPKAIATGNCTVRSNCYVTRITHDDKGRAKGAVYYDKDGKVQEQEAKLFVVSCNAINSPALLLKSTSSMFPDGLGNSSGLLGRYFTMHMYPAVHAFFDFDVRTYVGHETDATTDAIRPSDPKKGFIRGHVVQTLNALSKQPLIYAAAFIAGDPELKKTWGKEFKDYLRQYTHSTQLYGVMEDMPVYTNTVDVDRNFRDDWGEPLARITHKNHPNDIAMCRYAMKTMHEILKAAGAKRTWDSGLWGLTNIDEERSMTGSCHLHGSARMGNDPKTSVLDKWCRSHDVKNLFVVDGSFMPTSGGCNPTLTICANSFRVADYIIAESKKGTL